jgi:hypothetical protein
MKIAARNQLPETLVVGGTAADLGKDHHITAPDEQRLLKAPPLPHQVQRYIQANMCAADSRVAKNGNVKQRQSSFVIHCHKN